MWLVLDILPNNQVIITPHPHSYIKAKWLVFKYQLNKIIKGVLKYGKRNRYT